MRSGGGKRKGAAFERAICRRLSLWVSDGKKEDVFWRSAMSGGRATVAAAKGRLLGAQCGDVSCIDPAGVTFAHQFYVECKHYRDLDYHGLFIGTGKLAAFWKETRKQAHRYTKCPFLVAQQNRMPAHICLDREGLKILRLSVIKALAYFSELGLYVFDADWFFQHCKPLEQGK